MIELKEGDKLLVRQGDFVFICYFDYYVNSSRFAEGRHNKTFMDKEGFLSNVDWILEVNGVKVNSEGK
jgi:hypothetical protein